jgi:anti-sigma regulatory factor (Ser/Thr protein kinase)
MSRTIQRAPTHHGEEPISTRLRLPRRADAAFAARQAIDEFGRELNEDLLSDVRLLVTELIACRVQRPVATAASWVELDVAMEDGHLHVEVRDFGQRWVFEPSPFTYEPESSSGWGLYLVDRLADRWSLVRGETSTRIWFEFDLEPGDDR